MDSDLAHRLAEALFKKQEQAREASRRWLSIKPNWKQCAKRRHVCEHCGWPAMGVNKEVEG
jgi:hypothetical protein